MRIGDLHIDVARGRVVGGEGYREDDAECGPGARARCER